MPITRKSAKLKGRDFQIWLKERIIELFHIEPDEIRTAIGSENGTDIKMMTKAARERFPFSIEAKRQEGFANVYRAYAQAEANRNGATPILVLRSNRKPPLVVMSWEDFLSLTPSKVAG